MLLFARSWPPRLRLSLWGQGAAPDGAVKTCVESALLGALCGGALAVAFSAGAETGCVREK